MIIWLAGVHRFLEHEYFVYLCLTCVAAIWLAHCMQITSFDLSSRSKVPRWGCILFVQFFFHLFLGVASSQTPLAGFRIWVDFAPSDWTPPEVGYIWWFLLVCLERICSESKPAYTKFMKLHHHNISQQHSNTFMYAWPGIQHFTLYLQDMLCHQLCICRVPKKTESHTFKMSNETHALNKSHGTKSTSTNRRGWLLRPAISFTTQPYNFRISMSRVFMY